MPIPRGSWGLVKDAGKLDFWWCHTRHKPDLKVQNQKKIATDSLKDSEITKHFAVTLVWSGEVVPWSHCQSFPLLRHFPKEMRHTQGVGTHRPWDTSVL